jgi:hypothetical protein
MPDLDSFEQEVREKIKQLSSKDADARRKAASWLGEAGDPSAITGLAQTYKNDPDKRVREAAGYSLGMFRALQVGLAGKDKDRVVKLLEDVALKGKMGGRPAVSTRALVKVEIGLVVLAVFLFGLGAVLPGLMNQPPATATPEGDAPTEVVQAADRDLPTLIQDIHFTLNNTRSDAQSLQTQFQAVLGGGTPDCAGFYNNPMPYNLSPNNASQYREIAAIVTNLNQAVNNLATAKMRFDQHCDGVTPLTAAEVGAPMGLVVSVMEALPAIEQALTEAEATEAPTNTPEPVVTEGPTPVPPTPIDVGSYRGDLYNILDEMIGIRGANTLLAQYWSESSSGSTAGCRDPLPQIPNNYNLPPEAGAASLDLARAVVQINNGLVLVRQGWQDFANACAGGTVAANAAIGAQTTAQANAAFVDARNSLDRMR